jgi:hypothetical protein
MTNNIEIFVGVAMGLAALLLVGALRPLIGLLREKKLWFKAVPVFAYKPLNKYAVTPILHKRKANDICGYCGKPGAVTLPDVVRWPRQKAPGSEFVHASCQSQERRRACEVMTEAERDAFLRDVFIHVE